MIYIKATVKGEPDVPPLTRVFRYADKTDELILHHSVEMAREKLGKNMKLNVNEALLLYAYFVASEMRAEKRVGMIEKNAKTILSSGQAMVGVPETLRVLVFDAVVDGRREWVVLRQPISASGYIMAAE
jgi:urease gamma subunit